ncbi:MAG TPA: glycine cleavage system protein GcvH [Caulobacteraceae bacterium]|jgi:glycine cleavage system H protein|nr:glycine cleavage system protein GcvH [Caulobacteraceae bacterium]
MKYYTKEHEWLSLDGDVAVVGITQFAADALGDVVFVEVKPVGSTVVALEAVGVVESVKAASDIYTPVSGEVLEVNSRLADDPGVTGVEPEGAGWLFKLRIADASELGQLLDEAGYAALVGASGGH